MSVTATRTLTSANRINLSCGKQRNDADFLHAASSIGPSLAPPLREVGQYEQIHTREKHQGERGHRQEAHPVSVPVFKHGGAVEDNDQRKGDGQPTVQLPNPSIPVQWGPPLNGRFERSANSA